LVGGVAIIHFNFLNHKLATINHHQALTALGVFYKNGLYVKKVLNKALKYYQKGYKYGNLAAPVGIAF
jgi:TPR repeat protein